MPKSCAGTKPGFRGDWARLHAAFKPNAEQKRTRADKHRCARCFMEKPAERCRIVPVPSLGPRRCLIVCDGCV